MENMCDSGMCGGIGSVVLRAYMRRIVWRVQDGALFLSERHVAREYVSAAFVFFLNLRCLFGAGMYVVCCACYVPSPLLRA